MTRETFSAISDNLAKWCIYAVVFAAPFSKSISEIAIAAAIVLWAFRKILNRDFRLERTDLNMPLLVFVLAILPSFFNTAYLHLSVKALFTKALKFVVFYFVIVETVKTKQGLKNLFVVAFLSMAIIMLDGFIQYYVTQVDLLHLPGYHSFKTRGANETDGPFRGFPTACFPFPNDLAAWILLVLFPLVSLTIFDLRKNWFRYPAGLVSAGLFYLFFLTKARGAWVALAISASYIALSKRKMWIILLLILAIAAPFVLKMEMAQYIFAFKSVGDRVFMWNTSWEIFKDHPIIGSGLNTFFQNFKERRNDEWKNKKGSYAHNCYLQMACDTGVVGLGAFLWLVAAYFHSVVRSLKKISEAFYGSILLGISTGVFAFLIHSFTDTNLYSLNLATLFWSAIGISQAMVKTLEA